MESEEIIMIVIISIIGLIILSLHMCCAFSTGLKEGISIVILGFGGVGLFVYLSYLLFKTAYKVEETNMIFFLLYLVFGTLLSVVAICYLVCIYDYIGNYDYSSNFYDVLKLPCYPIIYLFNKCKREKKKSNETRQPPPYSV